MLVERLSEWGCKLGMRQRRLTRLVESWVACLFLFQGCLSSTISWVVFGSASPYKTIPVMKTGHKNYKQYYKETMQHEKKRLLSVTWEGDGSPTVCTPSFELRRLLRLLETSSVRLFLFIEYMDLFIEQRITHAFILIYFKM